MANPIGPGAGPGVGPGAIPGSDKNPLNFLARGKKWAGTAGGKLSIGSLVGMFIMDKLLQTRHEQGIQNIQLEGMKRQEELVTSENLLGQAALPAAQEEESMARNALLMQLSGGVLGPTVARGNRMIGG